MDIQNPLLQPATIKRKGGSVPPSLQASRSPGYRKWASASSYFPCSAKCITVMVVLCCLWRPPQHPCYMAVFGAPVSRSSCQALVCGIPGYWLLYAVVWSVRFLFDFKHPCLYYQFLVYDAKSLFVLLRSCLLLQMFVYGLKSKIFPYGVRLFCFCRLVCVVWENFVIQF